MISKKTLLTLFTLGTTATVFASPCEQYLKSFEKQHKTIGLISAFNMTDDSVHRAVHAESKINNALAGMALNLQLMQMQGCKNFPNYGIDVLAYEADGATCYLETYLGSKKTHKTCTDPEKSTVATSKY